MCIRDSYEDSAITLTLTQRAALYYAGAIMQQFDWKHRNAPTDLKNFIGNGTNLDSLFTINVNAGVLWMMIERISGVSMMYGLSDWRSIMDNQPAISGYTALTTQVVAKANGAGAQKNVAQWIVNRYVDKQNAQDALKAQDVQRIVNWSRN